MNNLKWLVSRYWNRLAFWVIGLGKAMIWDQTGKNSDLLSTLIDDTARSILTND